ncbi:MULTISPECIES: complex I NDUFA9 subunit family protein [Sphingomonas]|uniref:complex I NDUFA9 subunit family protein n=1 Tax=Sphingomonas TaxID=13687 RepID=UPI000F7E7A13|nr:complex I NDUFA9 subunit family protein [Sphingomonas sp. ABOLF]RSV14253.1 complex I NDUFA9 subunit family protein [Sphingomonas sp. ABOLF]GLK21017.1 3-beta-hydroxy-Delta(5)-steroid dehydrogenase [Microbacterium terregens]
MKNKVITLIGGGGFVGRYVAQALLRRGARVRIAQRDPRQAYFLRTQSALGQTQFIAADVRRPDTIARAMMGADAVVNLAGTLGSDADAVQAKGAAAVAEAARAAGVEALVHFSAIGADAQGETPYARSKGEGEAAVRQHFPNATILRPSLIFGREDQFANRFARMVEKLPVVPVIAPKTRFQPVYVVDVAAAAVAALEDPERFGGRTFELGGPDVLSMAELIRQIASLLDRKIRTVELGTGTAGLVAALPGTPITRDQLRMLGHDNLVSPGAEGLVELGVTPTPFESVAPQWLVQFRRYGRFSRHAHTA